MCCLVKSRRETTFFPFLPPSQETCEGKVTQLYSGFGYEQIVKMAWTSLLLQPMVIWRPWQVQLRFFTQELVAEREQPRVHQKVWRKVSPIHPKKTYFGWWDPDTCNLIGCGKGTPEELLILFTLLFLSGMQQLREMIPQVSMINPFWYLHQNQNNKIRL